jgi:DNA-binding transcriptional ArsR family regulator
LQYTPQPWVRRVVLIPHLAMRPWNLLNAWDDTTLVCYPAADDDAPADPDAPPVRLVRLHKALGDEKRLRMLKTLARGAATLQQLADATGLAKSSAHHHTVILRSAGLVTVTLEDTSRYALRRDALPEVARWLDSFLEESR